MIKKYDTATRIALGSDHVLRHTMLARVNYRTDDTSTLFTTTTTKTAKEWTSRIII